MSKSLFFVNFHRIRSPFSVWGKLEPKVRRNTSTPPISQSFGLRMKWTSQLLRSSVPNRSREEATNASLLEAILYTPGKVKWSGDSPHQWSVQSFTLSPTPTSNRIFLLKISSTPNCHNHFPSKALLRVVIFLTPNPPFSRGAHTLSRPTKWVLESPYKKSLCNLSILLATCVGIVKRDKK